MNIAAVAVRLLRGAAMLVLLTGSARASPPVPPTPQADLDCKFRHATVEIDALDKMPKPVADFIRSETDGMAPRGDFFNSTDVIVASAPGRRFIRAGHAGDRWFLFYERGGIVYSKNIAVLSLAPGQTNPRLLAHLGYFREDPCALTDAVLDGRAVPAALQSPWW